jgi:hypothetical protein
LDEFKALTHRQINLFFDQAQRRHNRDRADRIADINAGFAGGKGTTELIQSLTKED